jgi:hypothetical protein
VQTASAETARGDARGFSMAQRPAEELATAERAALEQLGAADGYATRWPVGRQVARSLADRQLVVIASDYVLLTEAGRRALATGDPGPDEPGLSR